MKEIISVSILCVHSFDNDIIALLERHIKKTREREKNGAI
jgi:hypothetical protein